MAFVRQRRLPPFLTIPLFPFMLGIFFVFHGFTENFLLVPVSSALRLLGIYLGVTLSIQLLASIIYKDSRKAAMFTCIVMAIQYFFGSIHDVAKEFLSESLFVKYAFLIPLILIMIVSAFILIKRKKDFRRGVIYLNVLLIVLLALDSMSLVGRIYRYNQMQNLRSFGESLAPCDTCRKPDIYLIVADEYAGSKTLIDLYNFDNGLFLDKLRARGFDIVDSSMSNYNITPISIASMLNLQPIEYKGRNLSEISMRPIYQAIDTNILVRFLKLQGYQFINNSIFMVDGTSPRVIQSFNPQGSKIISSQTLSSRLVRDLGYHLFDWDILKDPDAGRYRVRNNNEDVINNLRRIADIKSSKPRVIYSHLMMPHSPYFFDRLGQPFPDSDIISGSEWLENHYVEYLQYVNQRLLSLVDHLLTKSAQPPVIILISDHGFRHYSKNVSVDYDFFNLNATYWPPGYDVHVREDISNLSFMRSMLNVLFHQDLKIVKRDRYYIPLPIYHKVADSSFRRN